MKRHVIRKRSEPEGFVLMAAILILPILLVVGVGLLSLSAIEIRKSDRQRAREEAQRNARLALMEALGRVQRHLGPDQRVAANGEILGSGEGGSEEAKHWLHVWRTTREDGTPFIVRRGDEGGLADLRFEGGWKAADEKQAVLVSGEGAIDRERMVEMVGEGSLGKGGTAERVQAPRVDLAAGSGGYAWWVGDLSQRASLATGDAWEKQREELKQIRGMQVAQDVSALPFREKGELSFEERRKLVTEGTFELTRGEVEDSGYHGWSARSMGLLTDAREGGFKKDLTAYLLSDGSVPRLSEGEVEEAGLRDEDRLVGPANAEADQAAVDRGESSRLERISPRFGLLRDWARQAESIPMGDHQEDLRPGAVAPKKAGSRNNKPSEFRERSKIDLQPVLVEGSMYYQLSYYAPSNPTATNPYGLRIHYYPRVALWNPYAFRLKVPESAIFFHINGNKMIEVNLEGGQAVRYRMNWGVNVDKSRSSTCGSMFFKMDGVELEPGEVRVWSPAKNAIYEESAFYMNLLTSTVAPSPGRAFYLQTRADKNPLFEIVPSNPVVPGVVNDFLLAKPIDWREVVPVKNAGNVQTGGVAQYTQADDYLVSWKPLKGTGTFNLATFADLQQGKMISCAFQYGDEDELPVEWSQADPVPFTMSGLSDALVSQAPDRRTRDGFRLRWFDEHPSNRMGAGSLAGTPFLECSAIGTWNLRASYSFRSPFENVSDIAPHFFGIYTRDLFDSAVDWNGMTPRTDGGKCLGDPFDQPVRGTGPKILFDLPRRGAEVASLGTFQHVGFSDLIWHPTYAFGNSLVDPRVDRRGTQPDRRESINQERGGWNERSIGYSTDGRSNTNGDVPTTREDNWAYAARSLLQHEAEEQNLIFDLSYELNHSLWDRYFVSSGTENEKARFIQDPEANPLPNGRLKPMPGLAEKVRGEIQDYHRAASRLWVDGAFNVNSTSVEAWEALLLSGLGTRVEDGVSFPRILRRETTVWDGKDAQTAEAWSGERVLNREEVRALAESIVAEVKERGPFLSMADFVNRRLDRSEAGRMGALQAALARSGVNRAFEQAWPLNRSEPLPDYTHSDHIEDATRIEQTMKPETTAWGALGYVTQADLLQFLGPVLTVRPDTLVVRAYGESRDPVSGRVLARAWCEAEVQRMPGYVDGRDSELAKGDKLSTVNRRFGRRFEVMRFRWLKPEEV